MDDIEEQIAKRHSFLQVFEFASSVTAARHDDWQVIVGMRIGIGDSASKQNGSRIQQRSVSVIDLCQARQKLAEVLDLVVFQFDEVCDRLLLISMVR